MRAASRRLQAISRDVIDFLLPFFHSRQVVVQRNALFVGIGMGGHEAQQLGDALAIGVIFRHTLLENLSEFLPEGLELGLFFFLLALGQIVKQA